MFKAMAEDPGLPPEVRLFCKFGYEILATVTQACCVERINKSHGMVHSKARASVGSETTIGYVYVFTMECLLHKFLSLFLVRHPNARARDATRHHVWGGEDWTV